VPKNHTWVFDVKQAAGCEERKEVEVDPDVEDEVPNSKNATANFMVKFPGDRQLSTMKMLELKHLKPHQTSEDVGGVPIAAFECRGLEPTKWHPTGPYMAESTGGTTYDEVGFKNNEDWCEYDEKSEECMEIKKDIKHSFVLYRG
jgi:hypothetical protein